MSGSRDKAVAIVGIGLCFPGVRGPEPFWRALCDGADQISTMPEWRWRNSRAVLDRLSEEHRRAAQWGGFVDGIDQFDAAFFGISTSEAVTLDPKQRMALEVAWQALEDAGIPPDRLRGTRAGVFMGTSVYDYFLEAAADPTQVDSYLGTGNFNCVIPNRISYFLDLRGPSIAVETACSASLTAIYLASRALADGSASLALAGGAMLLLSAAVMSSFAQGGFLSPDGRCRAFDDAANGYVRGEGTGIVVLKRLADAVADGDRIYAVIAGGAINQDGRSNGLTAPNPVAQEALLREAYADAEVAFEDVGYVEAHGTGTRLGDPMEARVLGTLLGRPGDARQRLRIGSVKTNIGHLEAAAGVAGLIKAALCIYHGRLPPSLHFQRPNAMIDFDALGLSVPQQCEPWPLPGARRVAGVSSFSFAGANAHLVLTSAPPKDQTMWPRPPGDLLCISAKTEEGLRALQAQWNAHLEAHPDLDLDAVASTLQCGRTHFRRRAVLRLPEQAASMTWDSGLASTTSPRIAFVFPGEGSEFAGMGGELYIHSPTFRETFDACAAALAVHLDVPLDALCWGDDTDRLKSTRYAQPALFAVELAMAQSLVACGLRPGVVLGHGVGEFAAAVIAGTLTLADAAALVAQRGRLVGALPAGDGMLAVLASERVIENHIGRWPDQVFISAFNSAHNVTLAGPSDALQALESALTLAGIVCRRLSVSHALNSAVVAPAAEAFAQAASSVPHQAPRIVFVSSMTGAKVVEEVADARYWSQQMTQPVKFSDAAQTLLDMPIDLVIEAGPGAALSTLLRKHAASPDVSVCAAMTSASGWSDWLDTLAEAYLRGSAVQWEQLRRHTTRAAPAIPGYPFQRSRHWLRERTPETVIAQRSAAQECLHGILVETCLPGTLHAVAIGLQRQPFLAGHEVFGAPVMPGMASLCMCWFAVRARAPAATVLSDVRWDDAVVLGGHDTTIQIHCDAAASVTLHERRETGWTPIMSASAGAESIQATDVDVGSDVAMIPVAAEALYERLAAAGLVYGDAFRGIVAARRDDGACVASVRANTDIANEGWRAVVLFDACLHACSLLSAQDPLVPWALDRFEWCGDVPARVECRWRRRGSDIRGMCLDGEIVDAGQRVVARLTGLRLRLATAVRFGTEGRSAAALAAPGIDCLHVMDWEMRRRAGLGLQAPLPDREDSPVDAALIAYLSGMDQVEAQARSTVPHAVVAFAPDLAEPAAVVDASEIERRLPRHLAALWRQVSAQAATDGWLTEEAGFLRRVGEPACTGRVADTDLAEQKLLLRCVAALPEIAAGRRDVVQVLFDGDGAALLEQVYGQSTGARTANATVAGLIAQLQAQASDASTLRVLEVGAGTGATTAAILDAVDCERCEYTFSDISAAFLPRAQERFARWPSLRFRAFDLERDCASQGLMPGSFDVIVAANVVHATADIRQSLDRLHGLLAPGGCLILVELVERRWWLDLTFGLTPGWWRFTDNRAGSPLLSLPAWRAALCAAGFNEVRCFGDTARIPQRVIVAQRAVAAQHWWVVGDEAGRYTQALIRSGATAEGVLPDLRRAGDVDGRGMQGDRPDPDAILYVPAGVSSELHGGALADAVAARTLEGVRLLQAACTLAPARRVVLVTVSAQSVAMTQTGGGEADAALLGLWRAAALEHPQLGLKAIDVDGLADDATVMAVIQEALTPDADGEVALRSGQRWVPVLKPLATDATPPVETVCRQLMGGEGGSLDELRLEPTALRALAADEVLIDVYWSGLNFLDLMDVLGELPFDREAGLGGECVGRVAEVGSAVGNLKRGDWVMALADGAMADQCLASAVLVTRVPSTLRLPQASAVPVAYLTAHAALSAADLQPGESVLVHAAAGATGMALVALARQRGARVLATAATAKHAVVRARGADAVFDSRRADFASGILEATAGRGVDIVVNSLTAGGFVDASLDALAVGGRFIELSKNSVWTPAEIHARRPDVGFTVIDLFRDALDQRERTGQALRQIAQWLGDGVLPALPVRQFPADAARDAFRLMQQGRHVGKLALRWKPAPPAQLWATDEHGAHLVTGGFGGLGLLVAARLTQLGASDIVLCGRQAPGAAARAQITRLEASGARIHCAVVDMGDETGVNALCARFGRDLPPLRGLFHAAGTLADATLERQDATSIEVTFRAKVRGTLLLADALASQPLRMFVLFSSAAGVLGSAGQANHSAANAFLDRQAATLRQRGVPAIAVAFGAVADIGAAAARGADAQVARKGMGALSPAAALASIEAALVADAPWLAAVPFHADAATRSARLRSLLGDAATAAVATSATVDEVGDLASLPFGERERWLRRTVCTELSKVLGFSADRLDLEQGFTDIGIDSLGAVEMRNRLQNQLGLALPSSCLFDHPNVTALSQYLLLRLAPPAAPVAMQSAEDGAVDDLSADELMARLSGKLVDLQRSLGT